MPTMRLGRRQPLLDVRIACTILLVAILHPQPALAAFNSTSTTHCKLSDKSQAAVTLYTTVIMTIISTLSNRLIDSFILAWIAWLPVIRAAVGVLIYITQMIRYIITWLKITTHRGPDLELETTSVSQSRIRTPLVYPSQEGVPFLNHVTWWVWHIYLPLSQWFWFVEHYQTANNLNLFARGTALGAQLVAMSMDYKARAIRAVDSSNFPGAHIIALGMSFLSSIVRLSLLCLMSTEFIFAIKRTPFSTKRTFIPIYLVFSFVWGAVSFIFAPGRDSSPLSDDAWDDDDWAFVPFPMIVRPLAGAFFACFTSTIAFIVFQGASSENGLTISQYLKCNSVNTWKKFQSVVF